MADLIQIYTNNPTVMGMDGTLVSNGTGIAPISASLDAAKEEQKAIKCALRIPTGYKHQGNIKLKFIGENASMWKLAIDGYSETDAAKALKSLTWKDEVEVEEGCDVNVNYVFWVRAGCSKDERPQSDTGVKLQAEGTIVVDEEAKSS